MSSTLSTLNRLYLPLTIALVVIFVAYNSQADPHGAVIKVTVPFTTIEIPVHGHAAFLLVASIAALLSLTSYLFIDYAALFPERFTMEVFYDEGGLRDAVASLGELGEELRIAPNEAELRARYYEQLNSEVANVIGVKDFFRSDGIALHSEGETTFIVNKGRGLQEYRLCKSRGELIHNLEVPRLPARRLTTIFEHYPTASDRIHVNMLDLLRGRGVLLHPWFNQILAEHRTSQEVVFFNQIIGVTRVRIFPWPTVSDTVYFAEVNQKGYVPLAYARYL